MTALGAAFEEGNAAATAGRWAEAARAYMRAANLSRSKADRARARVLHAQMQLAQGKGGRAAWAALEQRFVADPRDRARGKDRAYWDGNPVSELTVWHEGPWKDAIQLSRYVQAIASRFVMPIVWEVPPELDDFASAYLVNDDVTVRRQGASAGRKFGKGEAHVSLRSLPAIFAAWGWPDPDVPPLSRPPRRRVPLRIGTWHVGEELESLIPRVHLADLRGTDITRKFVNDTVQVFDEIDIVIGTDGLVTHMAAALGIPVLLCEPYEPSWQWAEAGPAVAGPWRYESARVLRSGLVEAIKEMVR